MKYFIYKKMKIPTQSGEKKTEYWILERTSVSDILEDPLTGWKDLKSNLDFKLKFKQKDEAVNYAKKNNYNYEILENIEKKTSTKNYSDNFRHKRIRTDI